MPNYRAPLDAGSAFCYKSVVIDPARASASVRERWAPTI